MDPINQPSGPTPDTPPSPQPSTPTQPELDQTPGTVTAPPPVSTPPPAGFPESLPAMQVTPPPGAPGLSTASQKSRLPLIIYIVVGLVALMTIIGFVSIGTILNKLGNRSGTSAGQGSGITQVAQKKDNSAEVASYSGDFDTLCNGGTISNAAPFSAKSSAVIASFYQNPRFKDSWSYTSAGYGKSYYATSTEFAKINTVACLAEIEGSRTVAQTCDYPDDGKTVALKYYSLKYKLTYFEAKTGKKVGDGGTINAPANKCPTFVSYDRQTLAAFAPPDDDALELAHDAFIAQ